MDRRGLVGCDPSRCTSLDNSETLKHMCRTLLWERVLGRTLEHDGPRRVRRYYGPESPYVDTYARAGEDA